MRCLCMHSTFNVCSPRLWIRYCINSLCFLSASCYTLRSFSPSFISFLAELPLLYFHIPSDSKYLCLVMDV
ncbi:hypothetical protein BDR05DRAFT_654572 [Suillus weaverae]|nr:hypothetical protein BDR05DRAFT_654572 [Suillus weaverae]